MSFDIRLFKTKIVTVIFFYEIRIDFHGMIVQCITNRKK